MPPLDWTLSAAVQGDLADSQRVLFGKPLLQSPNLESLPDSALYRASIAIQSGTVLGRQLARDRRGDPTPPFGCALRLLRAVAPTADVAPHLAAHRGRAGPQAPRDGRQ